MKHVLGIYISGKLWRKIHLDDYPDFRKGQIITLGRRETCDICIPQGTISREHAHIKFDGKNIRLIDNRSLNGIYVTGRKKSQVVLENGMQVRIGPESEQTVVIMYVEVGGNNAPAASNEKQSRKKQSTGTGMTPWEISTAGTVWRRLVAAILDWIIIMFMILGFVGAIILVNGGFGGIKKLVIPMFIGVACIAFLYFVILESDKKGMTLGKRIMSVSVTDNEGSIINWKVAAIRTVSKILSLITLFLPIFGNRRCLHDLIAKTKVVKYKKKKR